jgi:hypothetical protein
MPKIKKSIKKASGKSNWIKGLKLDKLALTKKAKKAGESVKEFTKDVLKKGSKFAEKTKKQARLAKTFSKFNKKK